MANEVAEVKKQGIAGYLSSDAVKANIMSVVGEKDAQRFISSVVSAVQTNPELASCTNSSILSVALLGQSLKLPQSPQVGMFYFVPYKNKKKVKNPETGREETIEVKEATFQLSYRGYLQLAQRSGQYKRIGVSDIREGELKYYNPITEVIEFEAETDFVKRATLPVIGYYAYFELLNGFVKELFWSREQMERHAKKYSASYRNGWSNSLWKTDFDAMAYKTMIRQIVSKWGIMSVEMENAYAGDMAVLDENGNPEYIDNVPDAPEKGVDVFAENKTEDITVEAVDVTEEKA
jgi:recombination protein RecT